MRKIKGGAGSAQLKPTKKQQEKRGGSQTGDPGQGFAQTQPRSVWVEEEDDTNVPQRSELKGRSGPLITSRPASRERGRGGRGLGQNQLL